MRQIYILASDADRLATDEIETLLKQRGYLVRRAEEVRAFPPAQPQEITLALWSRSVQFSARQIPFTNRAIDAWTEGRLVFARLDHTLLPRGLGDVEAIDLSFPPARNAAVWKLIEAAQQIDRAAEARRRAVTDSPDGSGLKPADADKKDAPGAALEPATSGRAFSVEKAAVVGLVAAAAFGSFGFLSLPFAPDWLLGSAGLAWGTVAGSFAGYAGVRPLVTASAPESGEPAAPQPAPVTRFLEVAEESGEVPLAPVFVSYSRRNGGVVFPLVAEVEAAGRDVWIDRDEIAAGGNWAASIVRAIRASETFCLMCSAEAFQSDNVRREIYIADKYKRKFLPVRLDSAEMPEDFEYFLIDRQWLDLTTIEPGERADRLKAALGR